MRDILHEKLLFHLENQPLITKTMKKADVQFASWLRLRRGKGISLTSFTKICRDGLGIDPWLVAALPMSKLALEVVRDPEFVADWNEALADVET